MHRKDVAPPGPPTWRDPGGGSRRVLRWAARAAAGLAFVAAAGLILGAASAGLAVASVVMLVAVVGAALWGYAPGLIAALAGLLVLNYFFTTPVGSLLVARLDDLLVLVAFVAVAIVVSGVVARLNALRVRSSRATHEVELRLMLARRLLAGERPAAVMQDVADELVALYDLASCVLTRESIRVSAAASRPELESRALCCGTLGLQLGLGRTLSDDEVAAITALGTELVTALDRLRLEGEIAANRINADLARVRAGFLTAVTHDLRTPLATIKASASALLVGGSPLSTDERRELLEGVFLESAELEGLVTKVLEFTRVRSGELGLERVLVAPSELAAAAAAKVSRVAGPDQVEIDVDLSLPALNVDAVMLEHVLVNLLENALHYSVEHPVRVEACATAAWVDLRIV
ncbi:MAG TPA: DUF4118 domain-containing protein, partial [Acidimicrobiia bacterium]|nr:DUF4118 domain-containing protein [Acidimicrobiia bacterium]